MYECSSSSHFRFGLAVLSYQKVTSWTKRDTMNADAILNLLPESIKITDIKVFGGYCHQHVEPYLQTSRTTCRRTPYQCGQQWHHATQLCYAHQFHNESTTPLRYHFLLQRTAKVLNYTISHQPQAIPQTLPLTWSSELVSLVDTIHHPVASILKETPIRLATIMM